MAAGLNKCSLNPEVRYSMFSEQSMTQLLSGTRESLKEREMRRNIELGLANPGPIDNKARLRNKYDMQMPASSK